MIVRILLLAGVAVAGSSPAAADRPSEQARLARKLTGFTAGAPVDCIRSYPARAVDSFGGKILYEVSYRFFYLNETSGGCGDLGAGDRLVTISTSGRPCAGDIARTVRQNDGAITGSCRLGAFTPYRR